MHKYAYWLIGVLFINFIACKEAPKKDFDSGENYLTTPPITKYPTTNTIKKVETPNKKA